MKTILLLFTASALVAGTYGIQRASAAADCCDHDNARGCSPTGVCTACSNCSNCKHCKAGGTCSVCKKKDDK